jgi:predicted N-acetyltransferase YhbS
LGYSYRKFLDEDEVGMKELLQNTFPSFRENNLWFWKYRQNPSFSNSLVIIAEKDGKLVGSNYWLLRDLKLSSNTQVKTALCSDVAVYPEHRGQGIGKELIRFPRLSGFFRENSILMSYMFGRPELSKRFYSPAAGYTIVSNHTNTYSKLFNCQELKEGFQKLDQAIKSNSSIKERLKELVMCISFRLKGAPEFSIHIEQEKVYLEEGKTENFDMLIEGSLPFSFSEIGGSISKGDLVKSLLTGKIKIRKGILYVFKLRKIFMLFQNVLSQKP